MAALAVAGQSAPGLRIAKFGGGSVDFFGSPTLELWRSRPGNKDRIRNLKIARDNCGALFHVVGVRARDIDAVPCEIADRCPDDAIMMRLVHLDEQTGEFSAVRV